VKLTYRAARREEATEIFQLSLQLVDRFEDWQSLPREKVLRWMQDKIQSCIEEYTCILCDGEKAGFYRFAPDGDAMELDDLYVLAQYQNRGIGTAVLRRCMEQTDKPIVLYVFRENVRAVALYRRMGWQVTREVGKTRFIMTKQTEGF
jgi:ribosomal protein S18 acetylase RimI-like enzyme